MTLESLSGPTWYHMELIWIHTPNVLQRVGLNEEKTEKTVIYVA